MKKNLYIVLSLISLQIAAQTSISIKHNASGLVIVPNSTFKSATVPESLTQEIFDIKNTSITTKVYDVKRYDVKLNKITPTDSAKANFCFASQCYGPMTFTSPTSLTLTGGQSASGVQGNYQMLFADLEEGTIKGLSRIKYTVINSALPADSVQFTIQYNDTTNQNFSSPFNFSSFAGTGTVDPTSYPGLPGVNFGAFTAVGTGAANGTGAFSYAGWPTGSTNGNNVPANMTGSINLNSYYNILVSPLPGYYITLNSIYFHVARSTSGARNYSVRSSLNTYANNLPASVNSNTNLSVLSSDVFFWNFDAITADQGGSEITLTGFKNLSTPVNFRFYAWNAEDANGTFSIDTVIFNGASSSVLTGIGTITRDLNSKVKLYPNPNSDGVLTVEPPANYSKLELINIMGQTLLVQEVDLIDNKIKCDFSTVPSGTYFLKLSNANSFSVEKFILSK